MARRFLVPSSTCVLVGSSAARVHGYIWVGLAAASTQGACCAFYAGSTTADPLVWTLTATSGHLLATNMIGPFSVDASLVYADLTGVRASALIATACR